MEWYWAYADWQEGMSLMEEMFAEVSLKTFGSSSLELNGKRIDFAKPWPRRDYADVIKEHYGLDVLTADLAAVRAAVEKHGLEVEKSSSLASLVDKLFKNVRGQIAGPLWLVNPPVYLEPLSKRNPEKPGCVQRFQAIFGGSEQCKGFSELNDPLEQLERFKEQQARRDAGDAKPRCWTSTMSRCSSTACRRPAASVFPRGSSGFWKASPPARACLSTT